MRGLSEYKCRADRLPRLLQQLRRALCPAKTRVIVEVVMEHSGRNATLCTLAEHNNRESRRVRGHLHSLDARRIVALRPDADDSSNDNIHRCVDPVHWRVCLVQLDVLSDARANLGHWLHPISWPTVQRHIERDAPHLIRADSVSDRQRATRRAALQLVEACECIDWRKEESACCLHRLFAAPLQSRAEMLHVIYLAANYVDRAASSLLRAETEAPEGVGPVGSSVDVDDQAPPIFWLATQDGHILEMTCDGVYTPLDLQFDLDVGFLAPYALEEMSIVPQCLHQTFAAFRKSRCDCALLPDVLGAPVIYKSRKRKRAARLF